MLSLCLIVKPTREEAKLLDRCLSYLAKNVDEICLTLTKGSHTVKGLKECEKVAKKYKAKVSYFDWCNDFSKARNFNFKQAKGDYIFWVDTDDVVKGAENLQNVVKVMKKNKIDTAIMNYLYHFDKYKRCTTKHLKTRIVKNDGCVEWAGEVHEDFKENRTIDGYFVKDIEILHLTNDKRIEQSAERNLEIAEQAYDEKPDDPRSLWLMANAYNMLGDGRAEYFYQSFIDLSKSEEEKYMAYMHLADLMKSTEYALQALLLRPTYPNAYHKIAEIQYFHGKKDIARDFIEIGLNMPVPEESIIAYNPMDYDYYPLMMLANIHMDSGRIEKAVTIIKGLLDMYPNDKELQVKNKILKQELGEILEIDKYISEAEKLEGKELKKYLDNLPEKIKMHPKVCVLRNTHFIKEKSSGKDLVYYCGYTSKIWHPNKQDVGGSEEAVINLSREWARSGWNVTVYNNCGQEMEADGVKYKPYWSYNYRDKQDVTIFWRHPKPVDFEPNTDKIYIDLHDVIPPGEFTKERLKKIDKIFVKTKAHRILFPKIPDEKFAVIPNGVNVDDFQETTKKNPYLILNTSSPDRHLDATLNVFEKLIKEQPDKPWKLAWYYGWGVYDTVHAEDKDRMDWKEEQMKRFNKLKEQGRAEGGEFLPQDEIVAKYMEAGVFLYPTQFYEIHCISAVKAQLACCKMVTSDFAALKETVSNNHRKVHTEGERWKNDVVFGDVGNEDKYIELILGKAGAKSKQWAKDKYSWVLVAHNWLKEIK